MRPLFVDGHPDGQVSGSPRGTVGIVSLASSVSVVVITRDRPRELKVCLGAVLSSTFRDFDLVVVDQSVQPASAHVVRQFAERDSRVRHVPDRYTGAARARNIGTAATRGDIVVFTDDDCEPAPDWLGTLVASMRDDSSVGIAYGSVIPRPHSREDGFIIGFLPKKRLRLKGRVSKLHDHGISANVALRRSALEATGGFDAMLGPGSYFPCAEDFDMTYRVLRSGYALLHVPEARVVHHGLRDWQSGSAQVRHTYLAIGAAYMKHLRRRDVMGLVLLAQEMWLAVVNILRNSVRRRGPFGFGRLRGLLMGMWRSFELDVEHDRALYRDQRHASCDVTGRR
ncbi:MAG TPA: glycosyltransferase [Chloroflexota bacterium]